MEKPPLLRPTDGAAPRCVRAWVENTQEAEVSWAAEAQNFEIGP